jgi:lipopolysaccharide/colanic/teichoic acid biosynthesis glycosyltransferase
MPHPPASRSHRTRIGRLLVRCSFDEWPLLWNILRGDMSLVGPRAEELGTIDPRDPVWAEVLSVRPGATSAALVAFRGTFNQTPVEQRRERELHHLRTRGRLGDTKLLFRTAAALLTEGNLKRGRPARRN